MLSFGSKIQDLATSTFVISGALSCHVGSPAALLESSREEGETLRLERKIETEAF